MALAGVAALSTGAFAFTFDPDIIIERALNSTSLNVKYDGANASLVELRINGESVSTKAVASTTSKGEVAFNITVTDLKDGDNEVEIRLYDKSGKVLQSQKQTITTDQANRGPVYISGPKQGQTLQGPVEIKVGFGKELKNAYVSFFIDGDHKDIKNVPPYNYVWDTQKESNGWHTIEAWVVDELTNTYKSKQVRVFVNNPGGRTNRVGLGAGEPAVAKGAAKAGVDASESALKGVDITGGAVAGAIVGAAEPGVKTTVTSAVKVQPKAEPVAVKTQPKPEPKSEPKSEPKAQPAVVAKVTKTEPISRKPLAKVEDKVATLKTPGMDGGIPLGTQNMIPTGSRFAIPHNVPNFAADAANRVLSIEKGVRLEGVTSFSVLYNGRFVEFDVAPRVDDGVPMTPFRHLIEKAGGVVEWMKSAKEVNASADGQKIWFKVGDSNARINDKLFTLELAPYIDRGRTIVPLSFMKDALKVEIDYDPSTGHVLISKKETK